jgi:hypothetical protein
VSEPEDKPPGGTDSPPAGIPLKTGAEIEVQTGP